MLTAKRNGVEEHASAAQLSAFASDELAEAERASMLAHLNACPICCGKLAVITPDEGPPGSGALSGQKGK